LRRENGNTWLEVTLSEGKNRQIRRLGEHADAPVIRLARMSHAGISTDGVRVGEYRLLTSDELQELKTKYGVPKKIRGAITEEELNELPRRRPTTRRTTGSKPKRFVAEGKVARTKRDSFAEGSVDFDADSRAAGRAGSARVGASRGARRADSAPRERSSRATGATSLRATGRSASTSSRGSRGQDFGDREERRGASFARSSSAPGRARSVSEGASRVGGPTRTNATKKPGARSSGPQAGGGRSGSAASPKRGGSQKGTTKPLDRERGSSHRRKTRS
jgi:23S rRNA pseudouridine2605 synthase